MENLSTTNQLLSCLDVISARFASETFPDPCLPQMNVLNSHINASTGCIFAHDVNQSSFSNLLLYKVPPPPPPARAPTSPPRARATAPIQTGGLNLYNLDAAWTQHLYSPHAARIQRERSHVMVISCQYNHEPYFIRQK